MPSSSTLSVQLQKSLPDATHDPFVVFYGAVRRATAALGFGCYERFVDAVFCDEDGDDDGDGARDRDRDRRLRPADCYRHLAGHKGYDQLMELTQLFIAAQSALLDDCCAAPADDPMRQDALASSVKDDGGPTPTGLLRPTEFDVAELQRRLGAGSWDIEMLRSLGRRLFDDPVPAGGGDPAACGVGGLRRRAGKRREAAKAGEPLQGVTTFMKQLVANQPAVPVTALRLGDGACHGLVLSRLRCPPMLELIWSYWMEQGMLVQGINALTLRFQNRLFPGLDGLRRCDISPLVPLNTIVWSYIQREPNRLSLARRAYEYDHHYGLRLRGQAVPPLVPADSRTQFIECFHRLLREAMGYYRLSMNTTLQPDAFPALNALRDLHLLLAEGAHNQFGDLPSTARAEMLVQQWIIARPEVRDFLGGRPGVPYPEPWMPHLETLRQLMGWNDTSIRHYRDLATFGEQLLLSVRLLPWSNVTDANIAAAWLAFWRPEVQGYVHAYRAVTRVDLALADQPFVPGGAWQAQPSDLIRSRGPAAGGTARAGR